MNGLFWSALGSFLGFLAIKFADELLGLEAAARSVAEYLRHNFGIPQYADVVTP